MDTLLKFITIDKLGVSLQHISEPSTTAQAIEAATSVSTPETEVEAEQETVEKPKDTDKDIDKK